ncbi:uncharacterized protein LOC115634120 [Scaptodrosophila lebanonensis]|uniref:Uncharacterized protein LOC115634120 n=1 Tax=Drosophila lebanonensis TaxID=7225 RepID=A0A6J2UJ60_DROLE|nr:uncharacterized protein LOC115634120 [Scaptodrosophila lebanonensis]
MSRTLETFLLLLTLVQGFRAPSGPCSFANLKMRHEMIEFTGQTVLKVSQAMLLAASKTFAMVIDDLSYMAVENAALRLRLQLLGSHITAIERSQVLDLQEITSEYDLSIIAHIYDRSVPLLGDPEAGVLPKLSRLCDNVIYTMGMYRMHLPPHTRPMRELKSNRSALEHELISQSLNKFGMQLMQFVMAVHFAKFFEEFDANATNPHFLQPPSEMRCSCDREFLLFYKSIKATIGDDSKLEKVLPLSQFLLNSAKKGDEQRLRKAKT